MDLKRLEIIKGLVKSEVDQGKLAGASVAIRKDGDIVFSNSYGMADIEKNIKMEMDTIIRLFSLTKPITAVATMILFERGLIDLYHPVKWYIKSFENPMVSKNGEVKPAGRDIFIKDLLNMTSGISYPDQFTDSGRLMDKLFNDIQADTEKGVKTGTVQFMERAGEIPLTFSPGDSWQYGLSADVLGAIIETVSGKSYGDFLKDEIFIPLEMVDTDFYVPEEKLKRFAQIYDYNWDDGTLDIFKYIFLGVGNYHIKPSFESGGAGLVSTLNDYGRFAQMLANGGTLDGVKILGKKTVDFLASNQITPEQSKVYNWESCRGYGYGNLMRVLVDQSGGQTNADLGEFGWDGWAGDYAVINKTENLVIQLFIQSCGAGTSDLARKIRAVTYSAID
ncbi:MAG: serine hydrolase [Clostridiales bacterium]|nr:serine hydrolase [Clostridiales bacterium]